MYLIFGMNCPTDPYRLEQICCVISFSAHLFLACFFFGLAVTPVFNHRFACPSARPCVHYFTQTGKMSFSSASLQQLRANMREMEKLCARVRAEDAAALDVLVKPVRDRAAAAAQDFLRLHSNPEPLPAPTTPPATHPSSCASSSCHTDDNVGDAPVFGRQSQLQLPEIPPDQSAAESWDHLKEVCTSGTSFSQPIIGKCVLIAVYTFSFSMYMKVQNLFLISVYIVSVTQLQHFFFIPARIIAKQQICV